MFEDNRIYQMESLQSKTINLERFPKILEAVLFIAQNSQPDILYATVQLC